MFLFNLETCLDPLGNNTFQTQPFWILFSMQCLGSSGGWWVTYFANPSKVCAGGCGNGLGVISDCRCYNTAWRLVGFRKIHTYFGIAYNWPDDPDRQLDVVPTPPEAAEFVIKFVITCWAAIFEFYLSNLYTVAVPDTTVRSFFNMLWETAEWPMPYYNVDSDFMDTLWQ